MSVCTGEVALWKRSNPLQLNADKSKAPWCTSTRRQHQIPEDLLLVISDTVTPVRSVRDLGIYVDFDLSMSTHVMRTVTSCFAVIRQIRNIRLSVSQPVLCSLVVSLVMTRLDYGSALLAGLSSNLLAKMQSVLNAAARLVFPARKYDHVTPLLQELHWLRAPERIMFRLAVLVYRRLHGLAPSYLAPQLHRVSDVDSRRRLRSASSAALIVQPTLRSSIGDRSFPVAAARTWNSLPPSVTASQSLQTFRKRLKTELFQRSYTTASLP